MRFHVVLRYLSLALLLNAVFMGISAIVSLIYADSSFMPLLYSTIVTTLFGLFPLIFVPGTPSITNKEGLLIVVSSWFVSCLAGTLPYVLWGDVFSFTNAFFESVSGFTTTGSTILTNIEVIPEGLLFWRASTHWIGGIGIIIFVLSVLPFMGIAELVLFRSEVSSMVQDNFKTRAQKTINILAGVYLGLTMLETIALLLAGMNLYDAVIHSFATIATGGFSNRNASIAYYNSPTIEIIIMVFMVLSGMHFGLLFSVVTGKFKNILKSTVLKYYVLFLLFGVTLSTLNIYLVDDKSFIEALRYASFQIISVGTSTGFATADSSIWPPLSKLLLIFFALQCACSGSTSGGIKVDRIVIVIKSFFRHLKQLMHLNAVINVKLDKKTIDDHLVSKAQLYIGSYLGIIFIATMILAAMGVNLLDAFTGTVATIGNVGPGLGSVGSTGNFSQIPMLGKWVYSLVMLIGRLEIYAFFIVFTAGQWRKTTTY